jgi:hypothetical protein
MRKMPGEQLPVLNLPSLVKNWNFEQGLKSWTPDKDNIAQVVTVKGKKALKLINRSNKQISVILSERIKVVPGKKYLFSYVYHTNSAKFGSFTKCLPVASNADKFFAPRRYAYLGGYKTINRSPGEWQRFAKVYIPKSNSVRIALTLSGAPAEVIFDDIYFAPEVPDSRAKNFSWKKYLSDIAPALPQQKVNAILHNRPDATAEVKMTKESPVIYLDGKPYPSLIYVGDHFQPYRMRETAFQKAGIKLQTIFLNNRIHQMWKGNKCYDFDKVDKQIWTIVRRNPNGYFIIGLDVSPYKNWGREFPEEVAHDLNSKKTSDRHGIKAPPSYWSEVYRQQACDYIKAVVEHMKQQMYFKCVVGFHILGNDDYQFYYQIDRNTLQDGAYICDYPVFRKWLKKRYSNDLNKLRKSWNNQSVNFANAKPPVELKRVSSSFHKPGKIAQKRDYVAFLNESLGEFANRMCNTAKKASGKKVIAGMWWGRGASCGVQPHFAQTKVVFPESSLQFMGAQSGYWGVRENGHENFFTCVFDSTRIHNKIAMLELDFRTWVGSCKTLDHDFRVVRYWNMYDLKGAMLRDFGKMFSVGGGVWWFDMSSIFFYDPQIMQLVKDIKTAADKLDSSPEKTFTPAEIVFVTDEQNYYSTTEQTDVWNGPNYHAVRLNQCALTRAGIKFDFYYFDDIINRNMTGYKVYVFMNAFYLSKEKRRFIEQKLKKNGKLIVWLYAPGYLTANGTSLKSMEALTGFKFDRKMKQIEHAYFSKQKKHDLLNGISNDRVGIGVLMKGPGFAVKDADAKSLAYYTPSKLSAVAFKNMGSWKSLFIGPASGLTPGLLKNICQYAGVYVYNKTAGDMFMYHRDDFICMHGVEGNLNKIKLPFKADIKDLMSGKSVKINTDSFQVKLAPGETRLFMVYKR